MPLRQVAGKQLSWKDLHCTNGLPRESKRNSLKIQRRCLLLKMPQILGQKGQSFDPHNHMPPEFAQRGAELNNFNGMSQSPLCKHSPKAKRSRLVKVVVLSSFQKTSVWIEPARDSYGFDQIRSSKMLHWRSRFPPLIWGHRCSLQFRPWKLKLWSSTLLLRCNKVAMWHHVADLWLLRKPHNCRI